MKKPREFWIQFYDSAVDPEDYDLYATWTKQDINPSIEQVHVIEKSRADKLAKASYELTVHLNENQLDGNAQHYFKLKQALKEYRGEDNES